MAAHILAAAPRQRARMPMASLLLILVAMRAAAQAAAPGRPLLAPFAQRTTGAAAADVDARPLPAGGTSRYLRWPLSLAAAVTAASPPPRRTADLCRAAAHGKAYTGDAASYAALSQHLGLSAGAIGAHLPPAAGGRGVETPVDVTTVETLAQLVTPGLRLVLDPLLYLETAERPAGTGGSSSNGFSSGARPPSALGGAAGGGGFHVTAAANGDSGSDGGIPRVIHMTMRSKHKLQPHQVLSILSWGRQNAGYDLLLYDDIDMERYIRRYYPGFLPTFNTLKTPVERSDAWRYHVLCGHGGIYADTDTVALAPFDAWVPRARASGAARRLDARRSRLAAAAAVAAPSRDPTAVSGAPPLPRPPSIDASALSSGGGLTGQRVWRLHAAAMGQGAKGPGLVVGIENVFGSQEEAEDATYASHIQMIQWTMAARRGHPVVCGMGGMIQERLANETAELLHSFRTATVHSGGGHMGGTAAGAFPITTTSASSSSSSSSVRGSGGVAKGAEDPLPPLGHDAAVLLRTGPGIWSRAVHSFIHANGTTPEALVTGGWAGDMLVLPQTALGCAARLWSEDNGESFVLHMYKNSWKQDHFRVADARKEARRALRRKRQLQRLGQRLLTAAAAVGTAALVFAALALQGPLRQKRRRITRDE